LQLLQILPNGLEVSSAFGISPFGYLSDHSFTQ